MKKFGTVILVLLVLLAIGYTAMSALLPKRIEEALAREYGLQTTIGSAHYGFGPKLVIRDLHVHQPQGYGEGDALIVRKVTAHFEGFSKNPMIIHDITAEGVTGNVTFVNNLDNFGALVQIMDAAYKPATDGCWKTPTVIQTIELRNASIQNGTVVTQLKDRNSQPIGSVQQPLSYKKALGVAISKVLLTEREGLPPLALDTVKQGANNLIDSGAKNVQNFIDAVKQKLQSMQDSNLPPQQPAPAAPIVQQQPVQPKPQVVTPAPATTH